MARYLNKAEPLELITVPSKHFNGTLPVPGWTIGVNHSTKQALQWDVTYTRLNHWSFSLDGASTTMGLYLYQTEPMELITEPSKHYNGKLPIPGWTIGGNHSTK